MTEFKKKQNGEKTKKDLGEKARVKNFFRGARA